MLSTPHAPACDLTISIGTLGSFDTLQSCLDSIRQEDAPGFTYQIWVVYNGSGDPQIAARIQRTFPEVKLITRPHPLGFCVTHNLVLRQCESRYALVLDDDTIVPKGTLPAMVAFMDASPDVGIAACKTVNPDGTFQRTYGLLPSLTTEFIGIFRPASFWPDSLYKDISAVRSVDWLNGSFLLVRAAVLATVGVLDEHYYTYACEPDWCYRIRKAGWRVAYVPHVCIVHTGGEHSINTTVKRYSNLVRHHVNQYYFFHKHYSAASLLLLRPIMIAQAAVRFLRYVALYVLRPASRDVAAPRIRAFLKVMLLSVLPKPYNLPEDVR